MVDYPTLPKIQAAVGKRKKNKALGMDILPPEELLKHRGKTVKAYLHDIISIVWMKGLLLLFTCNA